MLLANKKVAIIGAGPVGLTMAVLLRQHGIDVKVFERDRDAKTRIWGGTLDLHKGSGQDALKRAGLLQQYFDKAIPMGRTIVDHLGQTLFLKHTTAETLYDNPEINRNDLRTLLLDSLSTNTVVWDRKFTGLQPVAGKWLMHFENQPDETADFVIGANGGTSAVRTYFTDARAEETGTYIIQGEVSDSGSQCRDFHNMCDENILMASYRGNLLVANPRNNGLLTYNVIFKTPSEWTGFQQTDFQDTGLIRKFLHQRFLDWHPAYHQLFDATSSFWGLPSRRLSLNIPWRDDRPLPVTLIGDAAHLMPPFAGQGANTGLLDALVLSENLLGGEFNTLEAALQNYEKQMFAYASEAQQETDRNEKEMWNPEFSFSRFHHE